jgi:hypothetical protein
VKTLRVDRGGYVFRWRGGAFVAVWRQENIARLVPDDMISVPESINRSRAGMSELIRIAESYDR